MSCNGLLVGGGGRGLSSKGFDEEKGERGRRSKRV